jgi:hypothetical protein
MTQVVLNFTFILFSASLKFIFYSVFCIFQYPSSLSLQYWRLDKEPHAC